VRILEVQIKGLSSTETEEQEIEEEDASFSDD
jgi:hypothetical protein